MRILLAFFIALSGAILPARTFSIAYVQSAKCTGSTCTLNSVGSGALLVYAGCAGGAITAVSDSQSQTVTEITDVTNTSGPLTVSTSTWYLPNANSGTHTFTRTGGFGGFEEYVIAEYSGIDTSSPYDKFSKTAGFSGLDSGNTATLSQADELLIGSNCNESGKDNTPSGSSFTDRQNGCNPGGGSSVGRCEMFGDRIVSSASTYKYTVTNGGTQSPSTSIVTFKAPGGGGSTFPAALLNVFRRGGWLFQ